MQEIKRTYGGFSGGDWGGNGDSNGGGSNNDEDDESENDFFKRLLHLLEANTEAIMNYCVDIVTSMLRNFGIRVIFAPVAAICQGIAVLGERIAVFGEVLGGSIAALGQSIVVAMESFAQFMTVSVAVTVMMCFIASNSFD